LTSDGTLAFPAAPAMNAGRPNAPRLILVVDQNATRLVATATALCALVPHARIRVRQNGMELSPAGPAPDVVLAHASPGVWAVASVLAAYHPAHLGRPVNAFLVADGPLEKFSVLITDFPGLRLVLPDADAAAQVAALVGAR
jgi:hypothetical protein